MEEMRKKTRIQVEEEEEAEERFVTIDPQTTGKTKKKVTKTNKRRNLVENLFAGHVIFSTTILVIHALLVTVLLDLQLTIDSPYYFLAMASIISISSLSLTIIEKSDDDDDDDGCSRVKIVLVVVLHASAALVVAPVLGRYGTSPFHVFINYTVITSTTILTATLWAMINWRENSSIPGSSKDPLVAPPGPPATTTTNEDNSLGSSSSIIIGATGFVLLILLAFFFWVNSVNDVTFETEVFSWFSVFSILLNVYTIGHMSYVRRTLVPPPLSVLDIVVRIHTTLFAMLVAFVVLVCGSILFLKAMVVTMDTMASLGLFTKRQF